MIKSVYIHIPFCNHICNYCDFCKRYYYEDLANKYLDSLEKEILNNYQNEVLDTIYIGGGTPSSLSLNNLSKLMKIVSIFKLSDNYEFTFEVNPENIDLDKIKLLKQYGVNRISMGVESTNDKYLKYLGRHHNFNLVKEKIKLLKQYFNNINVDLIYALKNETIDELKIDLENLVSLDVNHISTYSLMINNNTIFGILKEKNIEDYLDKEMYDTIINYLTSNGYKHYEISNFSKDNSYSKHNLTYWHNNEYYGFGLGASGYVNNIRYDNTRSMYKYLNGKCRLEEEKLELKDKISYELILGFRLINGINKNDFYNKYNCNLIDMYNIKDLIKSGLLIDLGDNIKISYDKIYVENSILINFVD